MSATTANDAAQSVLNAAADTDCPGATRMLRLTIHDSGKSSAVGARTTVPSFEGNKIMAPSRAIGAESVQANASGSPRQAPIIRARRLTPVMASNTAGTAEPPGRAAISQNLKEPSGWRKASRWITPSSMPKSATTAST